MLNPQLYEMIHCSIQLRLSDVLFIQLGTKKALQNCKALRVIPAGFEPTTHSLEGYCSIQLSYGTSILFLNLYY